MMVATAEAAIDEETSNNQDAIIRQQVHITTEDMDRVRQLFRVGQALPEDAPHVEVMAYGNLSHGMARKN